MISRRQAMAMAITALVGAATPARAKDSSLVGQFDLDHDGTVDLAEAKKAGSDMFDKLDADHDGTLSFKELRGRMSRKEFAAADTDKDGTLTKEEYLAVVQSSRQGP